MSTDKALRWTAGRHILAECLEGYCGANAAVAVAVAVAQSQQCVAFAHAARRVIWDYRRAEA